MWKKIKEHALSWRNRVKASLKEIIMFGWFFAIVVGLVAFGEWQGRMKEQIAINNTKLIENGKAVDKVLELLTKHIDENEPLYSYFACAKPQLNKLVALQGRPVCSDK